MEPKDGDGSSAAVALEKPGTFNLNVGLQRSVRCSHQTLYPGGNGGWSC